MPNKVASIVLSRPSPCDVPQGYASVAGLPVALLDDLVGHLAEKFPDLMRGAVAVLTDASSAALLPGPFEHPAVIG
ncbi:MAG: hypothetical protein Q8L77_16635 [Nitrospirota bacterium]|nr:hypothetical protein [Nitrospirota bacterium]